MYSGKSYILNTLQSLIKVKWALIVFVLLFHPVHLSKLGDVPPCAFILACVFIRDCRVKFYYTGLHVFKNNFIKIDKIENLWIIRIKKYPPPPPAQSTRLEHKASRKFWFSTKVLNFVPSGIIINSYDIGRFRAFLAVSWAWNGNF